MPVRIGGEREPRSPYSAKAFIALNVTVGRKRVVAPAFRSWESRQAELRVASHREPTLRIAVTHRRFKSSSDSEGSIPGAPRVAGGKVRDVRRGATVTRCLAVIAGMG